MNAKSAGNRGLVVESTVSCQPLRQYVAAAMEQYFETLDGYDCGGLYEFVLGEVEVPLLEAVLKYTGGNHSKAAQMLGINRATLRKKLRHYGIE